MCPVAMSWLRSSPKTGHRINWCSCSTGGYRRERLALIDQLSCGPADECENK